MRHEGLPAENDDDRYADWTLHTLRFPSTFPALAGRNATISIEHTEVAARIPASLQTYRAEQATFASDLVSPNYGYAVAGVGVAIETGAGRAELSLGEPATTATARWLFEDETQNATQTEGGFTPLATEAVWTQDIEGWTARVQSAYVPDARLIVPIDLRLATVYAKLVLNETHRLTRLTDTLADVSGGISLAGLDVSSDGGRTWRPASTERATAVFTLPQDDQRARHSTFGSEPDAQRNSGFGVGGVAVSGDSPEPNDLEYDLSEYAGKEVLVAFHASFSTTPAAGADEWRIRSLRVEADIFRGALIDLRLRAASDADGRPGAWEIVNLTTSVVRHGAGIGVRILQPDDAPHTAGFRTILTEVINRGSDTTPPTVLSLLVTDPQERGGRGHGANRTVPSLAPGASALITVRGADVNWFLAANATASSLAATVAQVPGESFTADNAAARLVGGPNVQERSLVIPVAFNVTPQALVFEPGKKPVVTFTAWVKNDGEDPATLGPSTVRLWKGEMNVRNLTNAIPSGGRVLPGEGREVVWSWMPDASLARGSYRAEVEIATSTARGLVLRNLNSTLLVGDAYFGEHAGLERFGTAVEAWTCVTQAPCAREESTIFRSAPASLAVGVPPTSLSTSSPRTIIDSPEYPLDATLGTTVRLYARHSLGIGEFARVLGAEVFANGSVSTFSELGRVTGRSTGYDELRFVELAFRLNASPETRGVRIRFDAPTPSNTSAPPFIVDDLSVAPLDASWSAAGRVFVADGVEKAFRVIAHNDGALADTYVVTMRDTDGDPMALPDGWSLEVVDAATRHIVVSSLSNATSRISIPPGGLRILDILVMTPQTGAGAPFRGVVPMALTLNSTTLPDLSRTLDLDLRSQGAARSDVGVIGAEVRGASEPPGRLRTIEIAVVNRGLAPALARLRVLVHPPDGVEETPENLADLQGVGTPTVTLGPGARKMITFLWTPRHAGEHRILVALDPDNALGEADRSDHERELDVDVAALPFPDLRVALSLDDEASFLGRPIVVIVNVTNVGVAIARDVGLSLRAGVVDLMTEGSPAAVGDLAPGETRRVTAAWSPEVPGNVTLIATAFARVGLSERVETFDDNVRTHVVFVREPSARLDRGDDEATFRLVNGGNAEETYLLNAILPSGWSYAIRIDGERGTRVELVPNGSATLNIEPFVPLATLAGEYEIVIEATSAQTGETRRRAAHHVVPPAHALRVALLPARIDPREPFLEILIENDGNVVENVTFAASRLPEGWRLAGTRSSVAAGARTTARLVLDIGKEDGPRVTPIELRWNAGPLQGDLVGSASVVTIHDISLTLEGEIVAGRSANATLSIRNDGNVAETGVLRIELPPGFATDLGERAVHVANGRSVELVGWLAAPEDAPPTARAEIIFVGEITASGRKHFDVSRHDLKLIWSPTAAGRAGEARRETLTVTNVGTAAALESTITLYVDGEAIATMTLGTIVPGTEADATLSWTPVEGSHTIAILVQTLDGSADAQPADNGRAFTLDFPTGESAFAAAATRAQTPTLPLGVVLGSIAILAAWAGRRRR
ncbi:MAG: CARDB domain-containing protein [Candidatus Thermoplasmatota archaeon]